MIGCIYPRNDSMRNNIKTVSYTHLTLPTNREVENSVVAALFKKTKERNPFLSLTLLHL